eukprot:TRINITY_DN5088_c0_g1_i1.p2 TRINITY_DN5088_c0_g1~~TRINITY_DN5088_c0_g1_i1.p2  ORF type:complete len:170 (+),score=49.54 TRINITY_DN5088_c0_g1_i1:222-731(+)
MPTIGVEFGTKVINLDANTRVKAQVWDTAGAERYKSITATHYRRAAGALVVYDITKEASFEHVTNWMTDLKNNADENIVIVLVGNKLDLVKREPELRKVDTRKAEEFAKENGILFYETSAIENIGVNDCFQNLINRIHAKKRNENADIRDDNINLKGVVPNLEEKKKCC